MRNLGCVGVFGGVVLVALIVWSNWGQWQDAATAASVGRCLLLAVGGAFLATAVVIAVDPGGRK